MKPEPIDLGITTADFDLETLELALETIFRQDVLTLRCGSMACGSLFGILILVHCRYCEAIGLPSSSRRKALWEAAAKAELARQERKRLKALAHGQLEEPI